MTLAVPVCHLYLIPVYIIIYPRYMKQFTPIKLQTIQAFASVAENHQ